MYYNLLCKGRPCSHGAEHSFSLNYRNAWDKKSSGTPFVAIYKYVAGNRKITVLRV